MGKRHRQTAGEVAGREAKRRGQKKQLYLALDDWDKGYSIHMVDVDAGATAAAEPEPLQPPPLLRLEASRGCHDVLFGATGSKILALWQPRHRTTRASVYDTATASVLADGPAHPAGLQPMLLVAAGSGGRLHALHAAGVHCLDLDESPPEDPFSYAAKFEVDARRWRWTRACCPLRLPFLTNDGTPTPAPSAPIAIASYAVHPDGRTVFVSAFGTYHRCFGTFSLDTGAARPEWARHSEWLLPFRGQGHYDPTLDAWVGLHSRGHVCACDVPPPLPVGAGERPRPELKLVRAEGLFETDPEDGPLRQSFITLASMGDAEFLILEPLTTEGRELNITLYMDPHFDYTLRVTKFRLKHDRKGQLRESTVLPALTNCASTTMALIPRFFGYDRSI